MHRNHFKLLTLNKCGDLGNSGSLMLAWSVSEIERKRKEKCISSRCYNFVLFWDLFRIHNALKGIPNDRDGLFDTIQRCKNHYQKRAYQCIKCMVTLFNSCPVAYQILQVKVFFFLIFLCCSDSKFPKKKQCGSSNFRSK